jgi:shikimate dehydrogenase
MIAELWGTPIQHSLSPALHNEWFQRFNLPHHYQLQELPNTQNFHAHVEKSMRDPTFLGANITIPYKQELPGALGLPTQYTIVNTLYRNLNHSGKPWALENTDIEGIEKSVSELLLTLTGPAPNKTQNKKLTFIILGNGATAISSLLALARIQSQFCAEKMGLLFDCTILCRTLKPFEHLNLSFVPNQILLSSLLSNLDGGEKIENFLNVSKVKTNENQILILNTIPETLVEKNHPAEILITCLLDAGFKIGCFDVAYRETKFLNFAKKLSVPYLDGSKMLRYQAARSFELWTGIYPI